MKNDININNTKQGMNREVHPSLLQEGQYVHALNANIQNEEGNSLMIQNEHSNILCQRFPGGYWVIGKILDINEDKTYYFLTNPTTKKSEIGYIPNSQRVDTVEDLQQCCGCNIVKKLGEPLETQIQEGSCEYHTIISDDCEKTSGGGCLNFDINHPIKDGNIVIKDEKCGKRIYWTDFYNPPRYIDLDNLETYKIKDTPICSERPEEVCLDCDKLRIFRLFEKPCLDPVTIQYGGNLKAGVYEFLIAYSDKAGNELSQYYSITNPISIFDENNIVLEQKDLDYRTNKGIRIKVSNLDHEFAYYKIAVIQRAEVNGETSYFIEGIHPTSDDTVTYYTETDKKRTSLEKLSAQKPVYNKTEMLTASNGYLFHAGLVAEKEYNLQPVVNLMGAFLRWATVRANEDLYIDGVNTSKYKGYMRNESYPLSVKFFTTEGYETALFPFINRPLNEEELELVNPSSKTFQSVESTSGYCEATERKYNWQYYNYAKKLGRFNTNIVGEDVDESCNPTPYEYGSFGVYQSEETYPDNKYMYDSSTLKIVENDIPEEYRAEFQSYFTNGTSNGVYNLKNDTDFRCKNIRHYKMPDNCTAPFMSKESGDYFSKSKIYPLGVYIDNRIVMAFLDLAVKNGLITKDSRDKITHYEIFRGDRSLNKSIIAKGLTYDMFNYKEDTGGDSENNDTVYYSNYPYNDLSEDKLHYKDKGREKFVEPPKEGNNRFTFHSPDTHFRKPTTPYEINVEGLQSGYSRGMFSTVDDHSKWVILSKKAYRLATMMAVVESVFEAMAKYSDYRVQLAISGDKEKDAEYYGKVKKKTKLNTEGGTLRYNTDVMDGGDPTGLVIAGASATAQPWKPTFKRDPVIVEGKESENHDNYGNRKEINVINPTGSVPGSLTNPKVTDTNTDEGLRKHTYERNLNRVTDVEKIVAYASMLSSVVQKIGARRYEWLKIFKENGKPENFAWFYSSEALYNDFTCEGLDKDERLRGLASSKYLKSGRYRVTERGKRTDNSIKINNFQRESTLFVSTGDYKINYQGLVANFTDNSRVVPVDGVFNTLIYNSGDYNTDSTSSDDEKVDVSKYTDRTPEYKRTVSSMYVSLQNYLPSQYGEVTSVKWLPTGYCGDLRVDNYADIVFGGDIFISRFSLKRKLPHFLVTAHKLADLTPFNYYPYRNIGHTRFYVDYDVSEVNIVGDNLLGGIGGQGSFINEFLNFGTGILSGGIIGMSLPEFRSHYEMANLNIDGLYIKPASKFLLYNYGIPQFLVESEINCNYRYAKKGFENDFYPHVGDYEEWTQESNVSIKEDNKYFYNPTYSKDTTIVPYRMLPATYDPELYDCLYDAPNGIIWSTQDVSEQKITDDWLTYKPLDFYQFETSAGKLIDLRNIESAQVLGRFENEFAIFNAIDKIKERVTPETESLGTGGIFAGRPLSFNKTTLGYAGTQHSEMVSCEYGHFWVDAKRGNVVMINPNGKGFKEITYGMRNWFKEHLPFKILKGDIEGLKETDVDNKYKGLGIAMTWDSRFQRLLLTKRDYVVKPEYKGKLKYTDGDFYLIDNNSKVSLNDTDIFEDVSWTLGYSPITESWISYYSFTPDYYVMHHNYFQSGKNNPRDIREKGLWSHLLTNRSYQVFYGKLYPFDIEYIDQEKYANGLMKSITYWVDTKRYHNEFDFAEHRGIGFNKAWVYNNSQNSGQLDLIRMEKNNRYQLLQYPKVRQGTSEILLAQEEKKSTFNKFYNRVRDENNNVPIWNWDKNKIDKTLNTKSLDYHQRHLDYMRGDWNIVRLRNDIESRFKIIFKWGEQLKGLEQY